MGANQTLVNVGNRCQRTATLKRNAPRDLVARLAIGNGCRPGADLADAWSVSKGTVSKWVSERGRNGDIPARNRSSPWPCTPQHDIRSWRDPTVWPGFAISVLFPYGRAAVVKSRQIMLDGGSPQHGSQICFAARGVMTLKPRLG